MDETVSCSANITAGPYIPGIPLSQFMTISEKCVNLHETYNSRFFFILLLMKKCVRSVYCATGFLLHTENILHDFETSN